VFGTEAPVGIASKYQVPGMRLVNPSGNNTMRSVM
jgi:hypothetical protein